jgi:hypothetical protein
VLQPFYHGHHERAGHQVRQTNKYFHSKNKSEKLPFDQNTEDDPVEPDDLQAVNSSCQ